jgi:hypothetical protein
MTVFSESDELIVPTSRGKLTAIAVGALVFVAVALGVGFMSWGSIDGLREYRFKNQVFLGIVPKDLDSLIARQSLWKRWAIRANLSLGCDPVNIPQAMLPLRISALLDEIERRFRR